MKKSQNCIFCYKVNIFDQITVWDIPVLAKNFNFVNFVQPKIDFIFKNDSLLFILIIYNEGPYGHTNPAFINQYYFSVWQSKKFKDCYLNSV